jgi:polysaccharide biosynthesis/export protein
MIRFNRLLICAFLVSGFCLNLCAGPALCQESPANQTNVEALKRLPGSSQTDYVIGSGDVISIRVFQQPELSGDFRVSAQGYLRLLFIDEPIKAAGRTEWELADAIRTKLQVVLRDPQVSVQVREARQDVAYVLGAVKNPKAIPVFAESRLLNMLAEAGGVSEKAGTVAYILRASVWSPDVQEGVNASGEVKLSAVMETVDLVKMMEGSVELNKRIFAGDVVSVPEANRVFVGGSVYKPDAFDLKRELTLTQAIALAGGTKPDARKSKVTIIRQEKGKDTLTELVVDLGQVEKNPSTDVRLQASDVVFIPSSVAKNLGLALLNSMAVQAALLPLYFIR